MSGLDPTTLDQSVPELATLGPVGNDDHPPCTLRCSHCGGLVVVVALPPECRRHATSIWRLACGSDCLECGAESDRLG